MTHNPQNSGVAHLVDMHAALSFLETPRNAEDWAHGGAWSYKWKVLEVPGVLATGAAFLGTLVKNLTLRVPSFRFI